jgi:DNA-binding PadR family transcriptional regulator
MDFDQCACSGKSLGKLVQPAIMAILARGTLHGYLVLRELAALEMFKCQPPDAAGVYRVLRAMEADGLLSSQWDLVESGPARRRFTLTSSGRDCLDQWNDTLRQYTHSINQLLGVMDSARCAAPPQGPQGSEHAARPDRPPRRTTLPQAGGA